MTILRTLYASAPAAEVLIPTIEIRHADNIPVWIAALILSAYTPASQLPGLLTAGDPWRKIIK
jgi:hypothetical protein